jgi:ABC-type dipeptide/oligopeptide/nickel transport system permease subunit
MGVWHRFIRRPLAVLGAAVVVLIVGTVLFGPYLDRQDPYAIDPSVLFKPPSLQHLFGTDELGRDLFTRSLYGGRLALGIAFGAMAIGVAIGSAWGFTAALRGGWLDQLLMRSADTAMAIPEILLALVFVAAFGATIVSLTVIIGLILVPITARVMRSAILGEMATDYYLAAVASGASVYKIVTSELLRNTSPTLLARISLSFATAIVLEASLSFLGLGVQPPLASWGSLVHDGYGVLYQAPTYFVFPAALIFISILALNLLADEIQVILDPRSR